MGAHRPTFPSQPLPAFFTHPIRCPRMSLLLAEAPSACVPSFSYSQGHPQVTILAEGSPRAGGSTSKRAQCLKMYL